MSPLRAFVYISGCLLLLIGLCSYPYLRYGGYPPPNPLATDPRYLEDLSDERLKDLLQKSDNHKISIYDETKAHCEHLVARLLRKYPFESLASRLAVYRPASLRRPSEPLGGDAEAALDDFEHLIGQSGGLRDDYPRVHRPGYIDRGLMLKGLHENTVQWFIGQQRLGIYRMRPGNTHPLLEEHYPVTQPWQLPDYLDSKYSISTRNEVSGLGGLHDRMRDSFIFEEGWGYVRSKDEVAGFESHRVGKISLYDPWESLGFFREFEPNNYGRWKIDCVQLVGLLMHETPVVYDLKNLPDMEEVKVAPTRELTAWELQALEKLYAGEHIVVETKDDSVQMFGAIRANTQCLQCHDGKRGDMLGAFVYAISRVRFENDKDAEANLTLNVR